ncbi:MAG TPA: hypothetical protein VMB21_07485 [Candidatus Limnocylindria bacterium]|jgi:hypothetical protein|nr:hypothetical protein [Candidatus Limnocylindria bacterium]
MSTFFPQTGTEMEWNAAYYRLEDYLRALRLVNKVRQSQLILHLLQRAAARHALDPALNPTTLALGELFETMDLWFAAIDPEAEARTMPGKVAFLLAESPEKWPQCFLAEEVPAEYASALRECALTTGPDLQISSMVPRPIDLPAPDLSLPGAFENSRLMFFSVVALCLSFFKR